MKSLTVTLAMLLLVPQPLLPPEDCLRYYHHWGYVLVRGDCMTVTCNRWVGYGTKVGGSWVVKWHTWEDRAYRGKGRYELSHERGRWRLVGRYANDKWERGDGVVDVYLELESRK